MLSGRLAKMILCTFTALGVLYFSSNCVDETSLNDLKNGSFMKRKYLEHLKTEDLVLLK